MAWTTANDSVRRVARLAGNPRRIYLTALASLQKDAIIAHWARNREPNWGDALTPVLIRNLSGKSPYHRQDVVNVRDKPVYSVIGSGLGTQYWKHSVVWGTGFIAESDRLLAPPMDIRAVRGPLTRAKLLGAGLSCPEVYGDPALLYPRYYQPTTTQRFKLGIIPHWREQGDPAFAAMKRWDDTRIIDIMGPINTVVDEINECELIASSSLHGLIAADAYGIPSIWIAASDSLLGDGFKFRDYFASVGRSDREPMRLSEYTTCDEVLSRFHEYGIDIDLEALVTACPFVHNDSR